MSQKSGQLAHERLREVRAFKASELRANNGDNAPPTISGYAAVFGTLSQPLSSPFGDFRELIMPNAFDRAVRGDDDVRALVDHDPSKVIGRLKSHTLSLEQDDKGLHVTIVPPETTIGKDIVTSIRRGDIDGMSFGFRTIADKWETHDGEEVRVVYAVELFEVSPVTYPAYPDTEVAVRSLQRWKNHEWKPDEGTKQRIAWLNKRCAGN